jgi:7,8-dihydropterin-6-yl-methyl-4-(beta-D-ribofuranosyl)aminobenzene 5'-phosphate synthase
MYHNQRWYSGGMAHRIHPAWWPVLALSSPVWMPWLGLRYRRFREAGRSAAAWNAALLERAGPLELPEVDRLELGVVVDERSEPGFLGDDGVSYRLRTELGTVLMDVGFGPATPTFAHNAARMGFSWGDVAALAITHLHGDHMGGLRAARGRRVLLPPEHRPLRDDVPCFLPEPAEAPGFRAVPVRGPRPLAAGIGTTGPLARSLFFLGPVREQALLARLRGRGLVIVTGCGHPGLELILEMARRLVPGPVFAVAGGLHFPLTSGRGRYPGFQAQMLFGTGKPPWRPMTDEDLDRAIRTLSRAGVRRLLLSAHDTCDHALARFARELDAEVEVLSSGGTWAL